MREGIQFKRIPGSRSEVRENSAERGQVPTTTQTVTVPVSDPAHPSHASWLEIMLLAIRMASAIGPVVVSIVDPKDAAEAGQLGAVVGTIVTPLTPAA